MTAPAAETNCIDIAVRFRDAAEEVGVPPVQIMGGIGSAALTDYHTEIFPDERRVATGPDFLEDPHVQEALRTRRAEDGTRRDLDILVVSADERSVEEVEAIAEAAVGGELDVSAFGLHAAEQLREQAASPLGWQAITTFVSDRYVDEDGSLQKGLFPFAVPMDSEVLETWQLEVGDQTFPIANPASTVLNYLTRSISGLRSKDAEKVYMMAGRVFRAAPELLDWTMDGPGQSQMELAGILQTLRHGNALRESNRRLDVGGAIEITAGSVMKLTEHEAFMLPDAAPEVRDAVMSWSVLKSRALGLAESQEGIVKLFRRHFESRVDGITKNSSTGRIRA